MNNESTSTLQAFLENTYTHSVPASGEQLAVQSSLGKNVCFIVCLSNLFLIPVLCLFDARKYDAKIRNDLTQMNCDKRLSCKLNFLQQFSCRIPNTEGLPTVQECRDLLELYNSISVETMVDIYSSLLRERRLILTGTHLAQISRCALAITSLIYPMHWCGSF